MKQVPNTIGRWSSNVDQKKSEDVIRRASIDLVVGPPRATNKHSESELLQRGMVGLYRPDMAPKFEPRDEPAPHKVWGNDIDQGSLDQMEQACGLPVSVSGALMPDAHLGYGLPIGGVLAVDGAVIPYAVGVDIACRMKVSVLDIPVPESFDAGGLLAKALEEETRFGLGAAFDAKRKHDVMDDGAWGSTEVLRNLKNRAWAQLGSSGGGNHFAEFGVLTLDKPAMELSPGTYLALMSHSGSRGAGSKVAKHYSRIAEKQRGELPKNLRHLAWLGLETEAGQEYWDAMSLMGRYAAANHDCIHRHVLEAIGAQALAIIENHHNFAWLENHGGRDVVVHRKGATPAGKGEMGVIPGSMGTSAYIVRGLGSDESLRSASHGAGRRMSRKKAKEAFSKADMDAFLLEQNVTLLSAGVDECPMAYKDIESVMAEQADLVEPVARFEPRLVKMAPEEQRKKKGR